MVEMSLQAPVVARRLCPGPATGRKAPSEPVDAVLGVPGCRAPPPIGRPPERLRNVALMMQGSYSPTETGAASSSSASSSSPRLCGVRFGNVDVLYHHVRLDDSKLPSDGLAPIGLGDLQVCRRMPATECEPRFMLDSVHVRLALASSPIERGGSRLALRQSRALIEFLATLTPTTHLPHAGAGAPATRLLRAVARGGGTQAAGRWNHSAPLAPSLPLGARAATAPPPRLPSSHAFPWSHRRTHTLTTPP